MENNHFDHSLFSLTATTYMLLKDAGFETVADLVNTTEATLNNINGFGEKELQECVWLLKRYGVDFYGTPRIQIGTKKLDNILDQSVSILKLSNRARNCLKAAEINTVRDLMKQSHRSLREIPGLGMGSLSEVLFELHLYGLNLPLNGKSLEVLETIEKFTLEKFLLEDLVKEINNRGFSVTLTTKELK